MVPSREESLLGWQRGLYGRNHASRANLVLHVLTVPVFWAGNALVVAALVGAGWPLAVLGLVLSAAAVGLQGRGHAGEVEPPIPFKHPGDALLRIVAEQWITFPRFVLDGGLRAAWARAR